MNATLLERPAPRAPASIGEALMVDVPHAQVSEDDLRPRRLTPNLALPVPGDSDPADAPTTIGELADRLDAILSRWIVPGLIIPSARPDEPPGWLSCAGQAASRTVYAALFQAIGTAYGPGDGATTFNLPNLVNRFPLGWGGARGEAGGEPNHVLSTQEMPVHAHGVYDPGHAHSVADPTHVHGAGGLYGASYVYGAGVGGYNFAGGDLGGFGLYGTTGLAGVGVGIYGAGTGISIYGEGASWAHNNMPPYQSCIYLIKT